MPNAVIPLSKVMINTFRNSFDSNANVYFPLCAVIEGIRNGRHAPEVDRVRYVLHHQGQADYDHAKAYLRAFTFCGTFTPTRARANLKQHSGIAHGDLDDLADVEAVKHQLAIDPRTVYAFVSPSGCGLKVGVHIHVVEDDGTYKHAWQTVATEYERLYGVRWDPSGKDVSRLCFTSYDPELHWNPHAALFDVPPPSAPEPGRSALHRPSTPRHYSDRHDYGSQAIKTAVQMVESAELGTRHHARLKAARLLGGYVAGGLLSEDQAYGALAQALVGHTEDLKRALKTVEDGLAYGQAHPITLEALEAERQAWLTAQGYSNRYTPSLIVPLGLI